MTDISKHWEAFRAKHFTAKNKALLLLASLALIRFDPKASYLSGLGLLVISGLAYELLQAQQRIRDSVANIAKRSDRQHQEAASLNSQLIAALPDVASTQLIARLTPTLRRIAEVRHDSHRHWLQSLAEKRFVLTSRLPKEDLVGPFLAILAGKPPTVEAVSIPAFWHHSNMGGQQREQFLSAIESYVRFGGIFRRYLIVGPHWQKTDARDAVQRLLALSTKLAEPSTSQGGEMSLTLLYADDVRASLPEELRRHFSEHRNFGVWREEDEDWYIEMHYDDNDLKNDPATASFRKVSIDSGSWQHTEMQVTLEVCRRLRQCGAFEATPEDLRYTERPARIQTPKGHQVALGLASGNGLGTARICNYTPDSADPALALSLQLGVFDRRSSERSRHRSETNKGAYRPLPEWERTEQEALVGKFLTVSPAATSGAAAQSPRFTEEPYEVVWAHPSKPSMASLWSMGLRAPR